MDKLNWIKIYIIICLIILYIFMIINRPEKKELKLNEKLDEDIKIMLCNSAYYDNNRLIKGCEDYILKIYPNKIQRTINDTNNFLNNYKKEELK